MKRKKLRSKNEPAEPGLRRAVRPRRRYLYEIEFFDAGHAAMASTPAAPPGAAQSLFNEPEAEEGPRDPRLQRVIRAAANGWVTSKN